MFASHAFLFREVAAGLAERLGEINRRFPTALAMGARGGCLAAALAGRGGIETLIQAELSPVLLAGLSGPAVALDEEALPFGPGSLDLVVSCLGLHWVNDLPGTLAQIRYALKPDGLFLAALFGGETLAELRQAWLDAESRTRGGVSPRVAPFVEVRDAGSLLQRAGFALPVADADRIAVDWPDALALLRELRGMGEGSALAERPRHLTAPATLAAALEAYPRRADGRIEASFEIVYLAGWAPAAGQQKPLRPGSAAARLADALEAPEKPLPGERRH
ncbi:MAG TPA: methyltransferase domain-containing protein [Kiloniellales bacterium]|nr:methyltransferase domain-containing protein [Kiloniellales bacterium]